jgi:hypothetical protein
LTKTLKSSLLCPEGAALFERPPPHFSAAVYNCIKQGEKPLSCGTRGLELVKILEASSESLRHDGAVVQLSKTSSWLASLAAPTSNPRGQKAAKTLANGSGHQRRASNTGGHPHHKLAMNGNGH